MSGIIGTVAKKVVVTVGTLALLTYTNYRLAGGPPIMDVYRQVKAEREQIDIDEELKKKLEPIFLNKMEYKIR